MAQFRDWVGWMETTEEVDPDPDTEKQALQKLINISNDSDEIAEVAMILGIDHHLPKLREELQQN